MRIGVVKFKRCVLVTLLTPLLLTACTGGDHLDDLRAYVAEVKARKHGRVEPLPEIKPHETFLYQAYDLRDPFAPAPFSQPATVTATASNGIRPDMNRRREPLEEFPLDTLRMVGTLERDQERWGLVQARDGTVHRLKVGNYIGQNYGKIVAISEQEISLVEIVPDGLGGWTERKAALAINE